MDLYSDLTGFPEDAALHLIILYKKSGIVEPFLIYCNNTKIQYAQETASSNPAFQSETLHKSLV